MEKHTALIRATARRSGYVFLDIPCFYYCHPTSQMVEGGEAREKRIYCPSEEHSKKHFPLFTEKGGGGPRHNRQGEEARRSPGFCKTETKHAEDALPVGGGERECVTLGGGFQEGQRGVFDYNI